MNGWLATKSSTGIMGGQPGTGLKKVAAAASVPSSFTSTKHMWWTFETTSGSGGASTISERSAATGSNGSFSPRACSVSVASVPHETVNLGTMNAPMGTLFLMVPELSSRDGLELSRLGRP
nr:unnamed protein product [Digitaria exilis]